MPSSITALTLVVRDDDDDDAIASDVDALRFRVVGRAVVSLDRHGIERDLVQPRGGARA